MWENIVLGTIQGITEWLPISSKSVIILVKEIIFKDPGGINITEIIKFALLLHLGTFLAALIYLRNDVILLTRSLLKYKSAAEETKKILWFLAVATLTSGLLVLFKTMLKLDEITPLTGQIATLAIGVLLLITGLLQVKSRGGGLRTSADLTLTDSLILGTMQGLAVIPGFSRSGFTVSALLLRKLNDHEALRLSFLMSLPAVLGGNIILNLSSFSFSPGILAGLGASFLFGILSIDVLLRIAKRVNFGYFVLWFGIITIISALFI